MDPETQYHIEDVGRILLQTQDALKEIRNDLHKGATTPAMQRKISELFDEAESNVRSKAQNVLTSVMRNQVSMLPDIPPARGARAGGGHGGARRPTNRDRRPTAAGSSGATRAPQRVPAAAAPSPLGSTLGAGGSGSGTIHARNAKAILGKFGLLQERSSAAQHSAIDRKLARAQQLKRRASTGVVKRATVQPQTSLPTLNRADASADVPTVSERDIRAGLYSMISRGFVPRGTDLGPAFEYGPAPLQASTVQIREAPSRSEYVRPETSTVGGFNVAGLKFDLNPQEPPPPSQQKQRQQQQQQRRQRRPSGRPSSAGDGDVDGHGGGGEGGGRSHAHRRNDSVSGRRAQRQQEKDREAAALTDEFAEAVEEIRGYNELLDEFSLHQFIVRKGRTLTDTPEYESFKRKHSNIWGGIKTVIRYLEELLQLYSIPLAYVDGQKVARLALDELTEPTKAALLDCIANHDEVIPIIEATGQRFKASAGESLAAVLIQSVYRMHGLRREYLAERSRMYAVEAIQEMWRNAMVRASFLATLWRKRTRDRDDMQELQNDLVTSWPLIRHKHRVVVHVPSVAYDVDKRKTVYDLQREQNLTLARLCDVKDPSVDVIYVAPFHMHEETVQYWQRVLQIGGVKRTRSRFTVVVPENVDRFPRHMSLTQLLLYSPRALNKIRNLVGTQDAYIVPAAVNDDTERLALELQIPIMGPRSEPAQYYSSCSGAMGIFAESKLMVPHGCRDIYDEQQFLLTLTKLITAFPLIKTWVFRIEGEFAERGIATLDPTRITGYAKVLKLYHKMSSEPASHWARPEVQQSVQEAILADLEASLARSTEIQREDLYPEFRHYLQAFCEHGGAIEARPPNIRGRPSAGLFIAPTGEVQVLCTHENVYYNDYVFAAGVFPQESVPPAAVYGASKAVGTTLHAKGIFGYVEVQYTVWYDRERSMPALWATDLKLQLTRNTCSYSLFDFLMRGDFDAVAGKYMVHLGSEPGAKQAQAQSQADAGAAGSGNSAAARNRLAIMNKGKPLSAATGGGAAAEGGGGGGRNGGAKSLWQVRSYVYSDAIRLRRIAKLQYGSFFNLCRLEHISFDLPRRSGTVFQLIDSLSRGIFGLMCIAKAAPAALATIHKNLAFIREHVSANNSQHGRERPHEMDNFTQIVSTLRQYTSSL